MTLSRVGPNKDSSEYTIKPASSIKIQDIATEVVTVTPTSVPSLSPNELSDSTDGSYISEIQDGKRKATHLASINRFGVFAAFIHRRTDNNIRNPAIEGKILCRKRPLLLERPRFYAIALFTDSGEIL